MQKGALVLPTCNNDNVTHDSQALTDTDTLIEKELLAIVFEITKFHH